MSIDKQHGRIMIECDSCNEVFTGGADVEWEETWAAAKHDGWKARKIAGEWLRSCPACKAPT